MILKCDFRDSNYGYTCDFPMEITSDSEGYYWLCRKCGTPNLVIRYIGFDD